MMSPPALHLCAEHRVGVSFFSEHGRLLARAVGPTTGNVLLRRAQYRAYDEPATAQAIVYPIVLAKLLNCRRVLQRALVMDAYASRHAQLAAAEAKLRQIIEQIHPNHAVEELRGFEGEAATHYFESMNALVLENPSTFFMRQRNRRPPRDPLNALLSFLYALLAHDYASALDGVGLDPAVGFLHRIRPGRPSLALDLMEELRPVLADRLALTLINRRQVLPEGFVTTENGAVYLTDETRRTILVAYQERKREELTHPFLNEKIPLGLVPHVQGLLLARFLRGDLESYPAFIWR